MIKLHLISLLFPLIFGQATVVICQERDTTQLTAVLVVGHVENKTTGYITQMKSVARFFTQRGVKVYTFYDKNARWKDIDSLARECNFFVYSGHGSPVEKKYVPGMLCIDKMISSDQLKNEFQFTKNPLVIYKSACYAAGASETDISDIGFPEARRRILHYGTTHLDIGASGYYATNYDDTVVSFLHMFFEGKSLSHAFHENIVKGDYIEKEDVHPKYKDKSYGIISSPATGTCLMKMYCSKNKRYNIVKVPCFKSYDMAYMGNPNLTLQHIRR